MAVGRDSDPLDALQSELRDRLTVDCRVYLIPLGDLYVGMLRDAAKLREAAIAEPFVQIRSGRVLEHAGWVAVDRLIRTALQIARALELDKPVASPAGDPFAELDGYPWERDEQPPRRQPTKRRKGNSSV